ncbi:GNAT family N-acetyltransferase, partial [Staphylococcus aureus]|uniref:GNAT family N-acetyltransferase n=2 Tax=Staphylococcus TaxID=1279 RepID=UPI0015EF46F9
MKKIEIQVSEELLLRNAVNDDVNDYLAVPFNKELLEMYGSSMDYRTKKSKEKVANMIEEIKNNPFEWVIDYNGKFIGQASLKLEKEDNKARYAIGIFNSNYWSKAIGSSVTKSLLKYAFNDLGLHK